MADISNSFSNGYYSASFFEYYNTSANSSGNTSLNYNAQAAFSFGTGEFTIEFWMNAKPPPTCEGFPANTSGAHLIDFRPASTNGLYPNIFMQAAGTTANTRLFWYISTANSIISNSTIVCNRWYHIAVTRDSVGNTRMFIDGLVSNSINQSGNNFIVGASRPIIGTSGFSANGAAFVGQLTNLRIIKGAAAYTGNFTVPTSPLTSNSLTSLLIFQNAAYKDNSSANLAVTANSAAVISYREFTPFSTVDGVARDYAYPSIKATSNNTTTHLANISALGITSFFKDNVNTQIDTITLGTESVLTEVKSSNNSSASSIPDERIEIDAFGKIQTGAGAGQSIAGPTQYWNS
jgi:hypothetical protein